MKNELHDKTYARMELFLQILGDYEEIYEDLKEEFDHSNLGECK